jgi:hypothetical protein
VRKRTKFEQEYPKVQILSFYEPTVASAVGFVIITSAVVERDFLEAEQVT